MYFFSKMSWIRAGLLCVVLFGSFNSTKCSLPITLEEYSQMPQVFELDNYDRCMQFGSRALYCTIDLQLAPIHPNASKVWEYIQKVSASRKNYRHDLLRRGICVPLTCKKFMDENTILDPKDGGVIKDIINRCYVDKLAEYDLQGNVTDKWFHCETTDPVIPIDEYDILVAICIVALILLLIVATFYEGLAVLKPPEVYDKMFSKTPAKILACFSVRKNWYRLTNMDVPNEDYEQLSVIQGVRFLNMITIIMAHACMVGFTMPASNTVYIEESTEKFMDMLVINGGFVVQTFLVMAGMLLTYHFFVSMEGRKEIRISHLILAFINRYIRLTPALLVVGALSGTWLYHLGRGPLWDKVVGVEYRNCRENLWTNLLYVNTFVNKERMCLQQSWYLATDTQLFAVSLVLVALIWTYRNYIKLIISVSFTIGLIIPMVITYIYEFDMVVRQYPEDFVQSMFLDVPQWHIIYSSGYTNLGGYVLGILFGYGFYKLRGNKTLTESYLNHTIFWITVWVVPLTMIFMGAIAYNENYVYDRFWSSIYAGVARNAFGFSMGVVVLGCAIGFGWYASWLLKWKIFRVLGRLTYCAYLIHVFFIRIRGGFSRYPMFVSDYMFLSQTLGDVVIAYIGATILCLSIEMPISALQKLMVPQLANHKKEESSNTNGNTNIRVTENKIPQEDNQISRV